MNRDQVFISYSHADSEWLTQLQTMLVPLTRTGFKVWADSDIKPGQEWKKVIEQALARTKVAVLLVSPDFLASRFIHKNELPPLLEAAKDKGLTIIWVPVRPSLYNRTVIADYQAAHPPATPLSSLDHARQEDALVRIAAIIEEALLSPPGPEMVVIPAGEFMMGSPENEPGRWDSEGPQHKVMITKPFAMGRYAVTFDEYDCFCDATGRQKPGDAGYGRGRQPVINRHYRKQKNVI